MFPDRTTPSHHVLDPQDRIAEILFGLIMVLTFTGSLSAGGSGRAEVREMLIGALGCNLAWGVIDAFLYLMACLTDRARDDRLLRTVQGATDPAGARRAIADALPAGLASVVEPSELEGMRQALLRLPPPPPVRRLGAGDLRGALGVFLLVFFSMFPVVLPFLFMREALPALRVSNAVAILLLFLTGHAYGRVAGRHPWLMGIAMVVVGSAFVGMTIALGG